MWDKLRIVNNVGGHDSWGMAKEVSVISFLSMHTIDKIKTNSNLPVCRRNLYVEVQWMTLGHILVSHSVRKHVTLRKIFSHECRRKWQNKRVALGKCSKTCSGLRKSKMSFISFFYLHFRASVQSKIQLATATSDWESLTLLLEVRGIDGETSIHLLTHSNEFYVSVTLTLNSVKFLSLLSHGLHSRCGKSSSFLKDWP